MLRKTLILGSITALVMLSLAPVSAADDVSELKAQMERLQTRLEKMEQQKAGQIQKEELTKMMKEILDDAQAAPALPSWMKNLKFYGDYRLRYEHINTNGRTGPWGTAGNGTPKDRNRIRMRLRFGITKTWWDDQLEVGFRLVTGSEDDCAYQEVRNPNGTNPTDTNQTMTGEFSQKDVWIDLMYAKYRPAWAKGLVLTGGKMKNPIRTQTLMTWDSDINPEGLHMQYEAPFFGSFKPYFETGFWFIDENVASRDGGSGVRDVTMQTYGLGFDWKINDSVEWFFGTTYYETQNMDCCTWYFDPNGTDNQWLNACGWDNADYGLLEMTTKVAWKLAFLPTPLQKWMGWFSWVHNCKEDYPNANKNPSRDRHYNNDPDAFGVGIQVGENKKKGDFSISYAYLYEEYGSVIPGMTDQDFGGPNREGSRLGAIYNIDDFLTAGLTLWISDPIHTNDNNVYNSLHNRDQTTTLQLDLVWKF